MKGNKDETAKIALWALADKKKGLMEFEKKIGPGGALDIGFQFKKNSTGEIEPEITTEKYSRTIKFEDPQKKEKILQWQQIKPKMDIWQTKSFSSDEKKELWLDTDKIGEDIDLSKITVGKHSLKVVRFFDGVIFDESFIEFEVASSIKSLITVLNRDFMRSDLREEKNRNDWLNDLSISYQFLSNGEEKLALERLNQLMKKVESDESEEERERNKIKEAILAIIKKSI